MSLHRFAAQYIEVRDLCAAAAESFAREARDERICAGLSQADVARAAGITSQYLRNIERGHRVPSVDVMRKIAEAIDP